MGALEGDTLSPESAFCGAAKGFPELQQVRFGRKKPQKVNFTQVKYLMFHLIYSLLSNMVRIFSPLSLWYFHISLLIESNLSCGYVSLFVCQQKLSAAMGENVYNE